MIGNVTRLLRWTSRRLGLHNMLTLGLLFIIVISVSAGIVGAVGGLEAFLMFTVAVLGMLVGWWLARTSLSGWKAVVLFFVLGSIGLFLRVGRFGDEFVVFLRAFYHLAGDVLPWLLVLAVLQRVPQSFDIDWVPIVAALVDLWAGVSTLITRVYVWLQALAAGESAVDPVAATLVWGLALWLVTTWAGWALRHRARPLLAIAPAGVLLMATLSYQREDTAVILTLLGSVLLLLALVAYSVRQRRWQAMGIDFPELGGDTTVAVVVVTAALVLSAAAAPSITIQNLADFMNSLAPSSTGEEGTSGGAPVSVGPGLMEKSHFEDLRRGGMPRRHLLGAGPELLQRPVMAISTGELPSGPQEIFGPQAPRHYWRSITYDVYTGRGWVTRETETIDYRADEPLELPHFEAQREVQQTVRIVGDVGGLLHATGSVDVVDQDYTVAWRSGEDIFGVTLESTTYQAVSLVSAATEEQLRSAGSDYPEWIQERYLALPDTVPDRVLGLARDLTATEPTPYDRAVAIETYLRAYPYTLDVALPPAGTEDVVDYFLFDLQEGYCDYYATSMVVLARAAGLPARLVLGYATGSYDARGTVYNVTEADAHAWAEVYFPEYGWIEFEPTGGRPPLRRASESDVPLDIPDFPESPETTDGTWQRVGRFARWSWLLVPLLPMLVLGSWLVVDDWRLRRSGAAAAVIKLYGRVRRLGRQLAMPLRAGDTPYEFAEAFAVWAAVVARQKRWGRALAEAVADVRRLADLYVEASYTTHRLSSVERWHALDAWRALRWRLWLARLFQWRPSLPKRRRRG